MNLFPLAVVTVFASSIAAAVYSADPTAVTAVADPTDRVWIEPPSMKDGGEAFSPRAIIQRTGVVQNFDESGMGFMVDGETTAVQVSATRVIWVEPGFSVPETIAALKLFHAKEYAASISPLLESVSRDSRVWRAQWLSMHLWQAAFQAQRYPAVLELVNQIDARPLPPMILGGLPIHWLGGRLPPAAITAAEKILANNDSLAATQLVAASWLLGPTNDGQANDGRANDGLASAVLQSLSEQKERAALAQIAAILLWRKTPPPEVRVNSPRWRDQLSKMPLTLVLGPTALVADRLEAAGAADESLELFLSVGMTPSRPDAVVNIAKSRSQMVLEDLGQQDDLQRLKQE